MARDAVAVLVRPIEGEGDNLGVASLRAGVKCIGTLLIGSCDLNDSDSLQIGIALLLKFAIDKRPKVRRCAHECLEKLLVLCVHLPLSRKQAAIGCLASTLDSSVRKKILISLLTKFDPAGESEIGGQVNQSDNSIDKEKGNCSATKTKLKRSAVLDLASSFVEGAKEDLVELIYNLVRQSFQATNEADLRGVYDTLSKVQEHGWFCLSHFAEVIEMLLSHKTPEDAASSESRFACFHVLMALEFRLVLLLRVIVPKAVVMGTIQATWLAQSRLRLRPGPLVHLSPNRS